MRRVAFVSAVLGLLGALLLVVTLIAYESTQSALISSVEDVPETPVALVLGASVQPDKRPSGVLHDRIRTAVALLKGQRVKKLLLSGDNRDTHYNEVAAMRRTALELGAPAEALVLDFAGRRTYDSCRRAREIFGVRSLVVVTQRFHLSRAVYLCSKLGVKTIGVAADGVGYEPPTRLVIREVAAWILALIDIHIDEPVTVLGPKEPIALDEAESQSF